MKILGLSFGFHDSSAVLINDGKFVAGSHEERFSRIKHDNGFPVKTIKFCLEYAGISISQIDKIVYYENPYLKFDRILNLSFEDNNSDFFIQRFNEWIQNSWFDIKGYISEMLGIDRDKIEYVEHHESHAGCAYYPSKFSNSIVLTLDGVGEWDTLCLYKGEGDKLKKMESLKLTDSIGLFYAAMTSFLGFEVNEGEYKVMGMAAYGSPKYLDKMSELIKYDGGIDIKINERFFDFRFADVCMFKEELVQLFGKPREPELPFFTKDYREYAPASLNNKEMLELEERNQNYADISASLQLLTENIILSVICYAFEKYDCKKLCMSGGVALNSKANGRIRKEINPEGFYIQPSSGDGGSALGAALYYWHNIYGGEQRDIMQNSYKGESYDNSIKNMIDAHCIETFEFISDEDAFIKYAAKCVSSGKVIGWFSGRSEWGPRALGGRSIVADPRYEETKLIVNQKIKYREPFRPFAPSVLAEYAHEWFYVPDGLSMNDPESYMLTTVYAREDKRGKMRGVVHHDGTSRIQLVWKEANPLYHKLISEFYKITGVPMVLNTSFNLKGEPIAESPTDAYITFSYSHMDYLFMNPYVIHSGKYIKKI